MANEGNQFWKQRSKHGRDTLFSSPELLWDAACEFFTWCDNNPMEGPRKCKTVTQKIKGKDNEDLPTDVDEITVEVSSTRQLYTWEGLGLFCGCASGYFRAYKSSHKDDPDAEGMLTVIQMISDTIMRQQFAGAASGMYKENIISRYLGLKDKTELSNPEDETFKVTLKI